MQKENEEGSREGTDDFGSDLDTDGFKVSGLEGLERDKRGELVVLLPDDERVIARQRGFSLPQPQGEGDTVTGSGARQAVEKGSQFTGVLVEEPAKPAPPPPVPEGAPAPEPQAAPPPVDYGPTQVLVPENLRKGPEHSVADFDLDFGADATGTRRRKRHEEAALAPDEKQKKVKKTATWEPPKEEAPLPPPVAAAPKEAPREEPPKEDIPFEEPELPDDYSAPVVLKRRRTEEPAGKPDELEPARIQARSYVDEERLIEGAPVKAPGRTTKRKMKLPKKVRGGGRKTSPLLLLMLVVLILVLAAVLAVQYVPEARTYYDKLVADLMGSKQAPPDKTPKPGQGEEVFVGIGQERVSLGKESDKSSAEAYANNLREALSRGKAAVSGKAK